MLKKRPIKKSQKIKLSRVKIMGRKKILFKNIFKKTIQLNGKQFVQKISVNPTRDRFEVKLVNSTGENIGKMRVDIQVFRTTKSAIIDWPVIKETQREKGLYYHMLKNTIELLKKEGVNYITAKSVLAGHKTLIRLGFDFRSRFGEIEFWKNI